MQRLVGSVAHALLVLAVVPASVDARCPSQHLATKVATANARGGVVAMTVSVTYDQPGSPDRTRWKLVVGGTPVAPVIETLAPGLVVYRLPAGAKEGTLFDGKTRLATLRAADPKAAALPAPAVTRIEYEGPAPGGVPGGRSVRRTMVVIDGKPPAGAVALVITDDKGTPLSWGRVLPGEGLVVYWHFHCSLLPDGTVPPTTGQKARVFWVDASGRASAPSETVTIAAFTRTP